MAKNKIIIIGAGFGGLVVAAYLAKAGSEVTILEKNGWVGGRAQTWKKDGYYFDMGPSWYWMPEVFDNFFDDFGVERKVFYEIKRLSPSYRIFFDNQQIDLPDSRKAMVKLFESIEKGAGAKLTDLLEKTKKVYEIAMGTFVNRTYNWEKLFDIKLVTEGVRLLAQYNGFQSIDNFLRSYFKDERLIKMLSFPIFFLGESTKNIPAVYSLMNHVDIDLGTWYPMGGFGKVAESMAKVARDNGVDIQLNNEVQKLIIEDKKISGVECTNGKLYKTNLVVSNSDYHQVDQKMLASENRSYSNDYWEQRKLAPSSFLVYLGLSKKVKSLLHHSLFFNHDWKAHNSALFESKRWPDKPLYYVSCPSKRENGLAPKNGEVLILLVPLAAGLDDTPTERKKLRDWLLDDLEKTIGEKIQNNIVCEREYCLNDFRNDYNAYKGNAYGLGQTLDQTAIFRLSHRSKKVSNLFFTGQFTVPGTGVPMTIISGKIVAEEIIRIYG